MNPLPAGAKRSEGLLQVRVEFVEIMVAGKDDFARGVEEEEVREFRAETRWRRKLGGAFICVADK